MTKQLRVHHNANAQRSTVKIIRITLILPSLPLECLTSKHYFSFNTGLWQLQYFIDWQAKENYYNNLI